MIKKEIFRECKFRGSVLMASIIVDVLRLYVFRIKFRTTFDAKVN